MRHGNVYEVYKGKKLVATGHAFEVSPVLGIASNQLSARMRSDDEVMFGKYRVVVTNREPPADYLAAIKRWDRMAEHYRKVFGIPRYKGGDPDGK